jgi:hypothetical protein
MSNVEMTALLDCCIDKGRIKPFLSLELHHPDVPDGAIVIKAYPFGKTHTFFGKNPQVINNAHT